MKCPCPRLKNVVIGRKPIRGKGKSPVRIMPLFKMPNSGEEDDLLLSDSSEEEDEPSRES